MQQHNTLATKPDLQNVLYRMIISLFALATIAALAEDDKIKKVCETFRQNKLLPNEVAEE